MMARERAAYNAGIKAARQMALTAAVMIEVRDDAREVRQQVAAAALQGLAEGLRALALEPIGAPAHCIPAVFSTERSLGAGL
jgi:hypothetical protein